MHDVRVLHNRNVPLLHNHNVRVLHNHNVRELRPSKSAHNSYCEVKYESNTHRDMKSKKHLREQVAQQDGHTNRFMLHTRSVPKRGKHESFCYTIPSKQYTACLHITRIYGSHSTIVFNHIRMETWNTQGAHSLRRTCSKTERRRSAGRCRGLKERSTSMHEPTHVSKHEPKVCP